MDLNMNRRDVLMRAGIVGAAAYLPRNLAADQPLQIAGRPVELHIGAVSPHTVRISVFALGEALPPSDGSLVKESWEPPLARLRTARPHTVKHGALRVTFEPDPFTMKIGSVQHIKIDAQTAAVSFLTGDSPLLGLGEGGPQFDRRGSTDRMRS